MAEQLRNEIQRLKEENDGLREKIQENERIIRSLEKSIDPHPVVPSGEAWGSGEPPVPGAIPARTFRDENGDIRILLCRTYAGEGWIYTPVADGWVVITRE